MDIWKNNRIGLMTIIISAYLINVGYLKSIYSIQRLATWVIVLFYLLLNINILIGIMKRSKISNFILIVIVWIGMIIITPVIHGTSDFSYMSTIVTMVGSLFNMLVVLILSYKKSRNERTMDAFIHVYMYSMVLYVLFTTLCIIFPFIRNFVLSYVYIPSGNLSLFNLRKYATRIGWAGFSGYATSMKCSVANLFALYYMLTAFKKSEKVQKKYVVIYIITLIGEFYYSRTGLIVSIIIFALAAVYNLRSKNLISKLATVIIIAAVVFALPFLQTIAETNRSLAWMLEPLLNFMSDDGFTSTSSAHIFNDMIFKVSNSTLIFGDGRYTGENGYYMKTDLGFMRLILYFGIPGLVTTYCLVLSRIKDICKIITSPVRGWLLWSLLLMFALFEFKGESITFLIPLFFVMSLATRQDFYFNQLNNSYTKLNRRSTSRI